MRMRMAGCHREMGEFQKAMDVFETILSRTPMLLNVQLDAARTFHAWGDAGSAEGYVRAIKGGLPDELTAKNAVWGWQKISSVTAKDEKYRAAFHESRYSIASARYYYARFVKGGASEKRKYVESAKQDIVTTQKLYPDMGGETWRPKYDALLRKIQTTLGEAATGLE